MPDAFLRTQAATLGITLPPLNEYAVGNVFFPPENPQVMQDCKMIMERLARQRGLQVLGWRKVPVDNSMLGRDPLDSEPETEQVRLYCDVGVRQINSTALVAHHFQSHKSFRSLSATPARTSYRSETSSVNSFAYAKWPKKKLPPCSVPKVDSTSTP